jgi:hypothetical protein
MQSVFTFLKSISAQAKHLLRLRYARFALMSGALVVAVLGFWGVHQVNAHSSSGILAATHQAVFPHNAAAPAAASGNTQTSIQITQDAPGQSGTTDSKSASTGAGSSSSFPASSSSLPAAGFTTTITHNGQITPGTLIAYAPAKNYKIYYGGDLVFSQDNLYLYQGTDNISNIFTVSIPDGQLSNQPEMPWNDVSNVAYPTIFSGDWDGTGYLNGGTPGPGTSWKMLMALAGNPAPGVYTIHLTTIRTVSADGGYVDWEYDGFITYTIYPESAE